jgi:hypothetical protein
MLVAQTDSETLEIHSILTQLVVQEDYVKFSHNKNLKHEGVSKSFRTESITK